MEVYNKVNILLTEMSQYTELIKDYKEKSTDSLNKINDTSTEKESSETNKKITTMNSTDIVNVVNTNKADKNSDINHFINFDELNKL